MILSYVKKFAVLLLIIFLFVSAINAQSNTLSQQGDKLVPFGNLGVSSPIMGDAVAISGDGSTILGGGDGYNNGDGAVWVYTRINSSWFPQTRLLPPGADGTTVGRMGNSTSLSYDGNTALIGAYNDGMGTGAAYIFTRSSGVWNYQTRLIGTPRLGSYGVQGFSVSLSGDGNTAIVGAYGDNNTYGAAYIYTKTNGVWIQQAKLTDINAHFGSKFGLSVAVNYNGNIATIGESDENATRVGSAWIFVRNGTTWTAQTKLNHSGTGYSNSIESSVVAINSIGTKVVLGTPGYGVNGAVWVFSKINNIWSQTSQLITSDNTGAVGLGTTVAISGEGNKIIAGGPYDNKGLGATWEYSDLGNGFIQNGKKLVGSGSIMTRPVYQGYGIGLSSDGNTSVIGGFGDNTAVGALWIFAGLSTDPTLSNIILSSGTLTPFFSATTISYSATVANSVNSITLTPTAANVSSLIKVNGAVVTSGAASGSINLNVGSNTISVLVTASDGITTKTYTITVNRPEPPPVATVTPTGPVTFCTPGSVGLTATSSTYTWTYQWLLNGSAISGATANTYTASESGTYTVTVTNSIGQSVTSAGTVVTVNSLPTVTASNNGPLNSGATLNLSSSGASTYSWTDKNGVASPVSIDHITTANAGLYSVIGTDANGCTNSATTTVIVNTKPAGSLNFDGNTNIGGHSGYVKITNPFTGFNKEITVEWLGNIDPASNIGSGPGQSLENVDGSNSLVWLMHYNPGPKTMQFYISDNGTWKHVDAAVPNGWHKYVGVASATGMQIYVDGVLISSSTNGVTQNILNVPNAVMEIGKDSRWNNRFYKGDVDEVRVWSRALCQAEIVNNAQGEINTPYSGLQEYYKFNQGNSQDVNTGLTTVTDASGNGRDGILYNFGNLTGPTLNWVDGIVTGLSPIYVAPVPTILGVNALIQRSTSATSCNALGNYYGGNNTLTITNADKINYTLSGVTTGSGIGTGSDQLFNLGVTNVTITASNSCGAVSTTFSVTLVDDVKPIALTKNITVNLNQFGKATITPQQIDNDSNDNCTSPVSLSISNTSFDCSNVGPNTVTLTVKDAAGNVSTADATVTVVDNTAPTVNVKPATVYLDANGAATITTASVDAGSSDNCTFTLSLDKLTFNCSNVGSNTVVLTATDASGNYSSGTTTVTVVDNITPTLSVPANITLNCQDNTTPSATGTATATDNCSAEVTYSDASTQATDVNNASHYNYLITRTWKATDPSNNVTSGVQTITVHDVTAPVITIPADVTLNCQDNSSSSATGVATATDNCSPVLIAQSDVSTQVTDINNPAHYNYTISRTWTATDVSGNPTSGVQTITVQDVTAPVITIPASVTLNCQDDNSSNKTGAASATDNCGPVTITQSDASTQVADVNNAAHYNYTISRTWTATDVSGNHSSGVQTITVQDVTAPVITIPASVTLNCQDDNSSNKTGVASATDNCGPVAISYAEASTQSKDVNNPAYYNYTIIRTWTATDVTGNKSSGVQTIKVQDVTAPILTVPANINVFNDKGNCSSVQSFLATASDNCSPVAINYSQQPGTAFIVGTTTVTVTATDVTGNKTTGTFTVTVTDNEKPTISTTDVVVNNNNGVCGAIVKLAAPVTHDNCGVASVTNDHPSTMFPVGTTMVTWTVTDIHNNPQTTIQKVVVTDTEKPVVLVNNPTITLFNGTATIDTIAIDNGSHDNCGIQSRSLSKTIFHCVDIGANSVTFTVTDVHGNVQTASAIVTVKGELPGATIASIPTSSIYTGGVNTNLYLGYGAQSTTLQVTPAAASGNSSTDNTYVYQWTGAATNMLSSKTSQSPVFTPTAAGYYCFTVIVTNNYGCTTTASISICVRDIRVAGSNDKVYICHVPPGNPGNPQTLSISVNVVPAHLGNHAGDKLGSCDMAPCSTPRALSSAQQYIESAPKGVINELRVVATPNPTSTQFKLTITSNDVVTPATVKIVDASGRPLQLFNKVAIGSSVTFGNRYAAGNYYAQVMQGTQTKVVKLIKML